MGESYANTHGIQITKFPPNWTKYGKAAGPIRNKQMAEYACLHNGGLIVIWDGISIGTKNMIDEATKLGLSIYVYKTN
jgi:hypothetical protein